MFASFSYEFQSQFHVNLLETEALLPINSSFSIRYSGIFVSQSAGWHWIRVYPPAGLSVQSFIANRIILSHINTMQATSFCETSDDPSATINLNHSVGQIHIFQSYYGYLSGSCSANVQPTTSCTADITDSVGILCNGKNSCHISPSTLGIANWMSFLSASCSSSKRADIAFDCFNTAGSALLDVPNAPHDFEMIVNVSSVCPSPCAVSVKTGVPSEKQPQILPLIYSSSDLQEIAVSV
jgi:hypothetical protein